MAEYISPIVLSTQDMLELQKDNREKKLSDKSEDVGIHEFVEEAHNKDNKYNKNLLSFIDRVAKIREGDFFIELYPIKDSLLDIVNMQGDNLKMLDRKSCPTPRPGHHVYHYNAKNQATELLWVLPEPHYIQVIKDNIIDVASDLKDLISFIYQYEDGSLLKMARKFNGEESNAVDNRILKLNDFVPETDTKLKDNKKEIA